MRVMRSYGVDYWTLVDTPIRAFWVMAGQLARLEAQDDLRAAQTMRVSQATEEGWASFTGALLKEIKGVHKKSAKADDATETKSGLAQLRVLSMRMKG